jgi:hypothetical protein
MYDLFFSNIDRFPLSSIPQKFNKVYNLALGDVQENGEIDDSMVSDNNDRDLVLATVIQTLLLFFQHYPKRAVYIEGNDDRRTRLYRAAISRELDNARDLFDIYGVYENSNFERFTPNRPYIAFLIRLKV